MDFIRGGKTPSSEALLPTTAGEKTAPGTQSDIDTRQRPSPVRKMACARRAVLVSSLCLLVFLGLASATRMPCHRGAPDHQAPAESDSFATLLKSASPASLHELLHRYFPDRFRDGVWASEHEAVEAVHQEDAALATSIVQLAKRDTGASSANSTSASTSSSETATESSSTPPPVTSTTTSSVVVSSSSSSSAAPTSSTRVPPVTSSTSSIPSTTPTSSAASSSSSETTFSTSTTSSVTTSLSSSSSSSSSSSITSHSSKEVVETFTSTSANGGIVTLYSTTFVPGDATATGGPSSTGVAPSLQNAAVRRRGTGSVLAGAIGFTALLLVV